MQLTNPLILDQIPQEDISDFNKWFDKTYAQLLFSNKCLYDLDLSRSLVQRIFADLWMKREMPTSVQTLNLIHEVKDGYND